MDRYRYRYIYPSIIRPPLATSASFAVFSCFRIIRSCSIWIKKSISDCNAPIHCMSFTSHFFWFAQLRVMW